TVEGATSRREAAAARARCEINNTANCRIREPRLAPANTSVIPTVTRGKWRAETRGTERRLTQGVVTAGFVRCPPAVTSEPECRSAPGSPHEGSAASPRRRAEGGAYASASCDGPSPP